MLTLYKKNTFIFALTIIVIILMASSMSVFAHSGRTDSSGGHHDNNNVSGLGSYHYHCGGYPAHLHEYGYCPYTDVFPYSVSISTDKSTARRGETINLSTVSFIPPIPVIVQYLGKVATQMSYKFQTAKQLLLALERPRLPLQPLMEFLHLSHLPCRKLKLKVSLFPLTT